MHEEKLALFDELEELKKEHALTIKLFNEANEKINTLERDVKRYFEITDQTWIKQEHINEHKTLKQKLMKVGEKE